METPNFTLSFSEQELDILNDVLRKHKIQVSLEEMAVVQQNQNGQVPILSLLYKVAGAWEEKQKAKQTAPQPAAATPQVDTATSTN